MDFYIQKLEKFFVITPCNQFFRLLNKKQSQKNNDFEQSTNRKLFQFEHIECEFFFKQKICESGIQKNMV